jgi:hypothetical protein
MSIMNRLLQAVSLAGVIALATSASPRAEIKPAVYGVAPGMSQAQAMAILTSVARCHVEKEVLDEGLLPSGTYDLYTFCQLNDGHGTLALRTTSSLVGERVAEIELSSHSQVRAETVAEKLARDYGVAVASAEHVGGEWIWRLSERVDLTLFVYPAGNARATVLRDAALQQEDMLARSANSTASAIGVLGQRTGRGG